MSQLTDLNNPLLAASEVTVQVDGTELVTGASLSIQDHEVVALLGPNGAGKTSLLRALLGLQQCHGEVHLAGQPVDTFSPEQRARRVSYLPQTRTMAWPNRVFDVVALGRFAHGVAIGRLSEQDRQHITGAIQACRLESFQDRRVDTLSGGELARVHCARVYATNAPLLVADEPTAGLDPHQQHRIVQLLKRYADEGRAVLMVLHNINLALRYATRLLWMSHGRIIADLSPAEVTTELIGDVFQVQAELHTREDDQLRQVFVDGTR